MNLQQLVREGGLQQSREVSGVGLGCCLITSLAFGFNRMQGVVYTFRKDLPNSHKGLRSHTEVGKKWLFRGPIIALLDSQPGTFPPYSQSTL